MKTRQELKDEKAAKKVTDKLSADKLAADNIVADNIGQRTACSSKLRPST